MPNQACRRGTDVSTIPVSSLSFALNTRREHGGGQRGPALPTQPPAQWRPTRPWTEGDPAVMGTAGRRWWRSLPSRSASSILTCASFLSRWTAVLVTCSVERSGRQVNCWVQRAVCEWAVVPVDVSGAGMMEVAEFNTEKTFWGLFVCLFTSP